MRPSTKAWLGLGAGVAVYEVLCPEGELMSEAVDRALEGRPFVRAATLGGIAITACHLANLIPQSVDPFHKALHFKMKQIEI
jgi:hypothetical protein